MNCCVEAELLLTGVRMSKAELLVTGDNSALRRLIATVIKQPIALPTKINDRNNIVSRAHCIIKFETQLLSEVHFNTGRLIFEFNGLQYHFHNMRFNFWRRINPLIELCGMWPHPPMKSLFNQMARNLQTLPKPHNVLATLNSSKLGLEGLQLNKSSWPASVLFW